MPLHTLVRLPSVVPGADFLAELRPWWRAVGQEALDPSWNHTARTVALDHLRVVARQETSRQLVTHYAAAEIAVNRELATPYQSQAPVEVVIGGQVRLRPADRSEAITEDYLGALRDERIRSDRLRERLEARQQLFTNLEFAWLWWVEQTPDKLVVLPQPDFDSFIAALDDARASHAEVSAPDSFGRIIADFIDRTDPEHKEMAVGLLRQYLRHFAHTDLVKRVDQLAAPVGARKGSDMQSRPNAVSNDGADLASAPTTPTSP